MTHYYARRHPVLTFLALLIFGPYLVAIALILGALYMAAYLIAGLIYVASGRRIV
jgi:hypothetical protein